ncbi:MAG: hypothetical protein ACTSQY_00640 [Candidatus Odinarchaeia archaeon]
MNYAAGAGNNNFFSISVFYNNSWLNITDNISTWTLEDPLNEVGTLTIELYDVGSTERNYITNNSLIMVLSGVNLPIWIGRINSTEYSTDEFAKIVAYDIMIDLNKYKVVYPSSIDSDTSDYYRVKYINTSNTTVFNELCSTNEDGSSPWLLQPDTNDTYGAITIRLENVSRLDALMALRKSLSYDLYSSINTSDLTPRINFDDHKGSNTSVATYEIDGTDQNIDIVSIEEDENEYASGVVFLGYGNGKTQLKTSFYAIHETYSTLNESLFSYHDIVAANHIPASGDDWVEIEGDYTDYFANGDTFVIENSTANNGTWTVSSVSYQTATQRTRIFVTGSLVDSTGNGNLFEDQIDLVDASSFTSSGYVLIGEELIQYTGISSNTLTGCTRGVDLTSPDNVTTVASTHGKGALVFQYDNTTSNSIKTNLGDLEYTANSPIGTNGFKEDVILDQSISNNDVAEQRASAFLLDRMNKYYTIEFSVSEPITAMKTGNGASTPLETGDVITLTDTSCGITSTEYRIQKIVCGSDDNGEYCNITASNKPSGLVSAIAEEVKQFKMSTSFDQGYVNIIELNERDNTKGLNYPLKLEWYYPNKTVEVGKTFISFYLSDFRAYSKATSTSETPTTTSTDFADNTAVATSGALKPSTTTSAELVGKVKMPQIGSSSSTFETVRAHSSYQNLSGASITGYFVYENLTNAWTPATRSSSSITIADDTSEPVNTDLPATYSGEITKMNDYITVKFVVTSGTPSEFDVVTTTIVGFNKTSHSHTVTAHSHDIDADIYEVSAPASPSIKIKIDGTDQTTALGGPWSSDVSDLDITTYISGSGSHNIILYDSNTELIRIRAVLYSEFFIRSGKNV